MSKRGVQKDLQYLGGQVSLIFEMPLSEIVVDFFDLLKSKSQGYASVDFSFLKFSKSELVKIDVVINGQMVDSLSTIMHRSFIERRGREMAKRLKEVIPRQMFEIPIQVMVGSKIIARESVRAFRKNVTAKLYGGDVTRKKKLLEKQKAGKKKMKQIGKFAPLKKHLCLFYQLRGNNGKTFRFNFTICFTTNFFGFKCNYLPDIYLLGVCKCEI